ncbi:ShlB/FhaC/HecB family hemolysin secretion/activation protein [Sphingobium aquiterrae]|uniref:ShlB/FhaC/HecB family hemolysin secretion/activation protein n=1 Tax=Sphingobium aquiterrae TaxID=2038656 RepID=UPI00301A0207
MSSYRSRETAAEGRVRLTLPGVLGHRAGSALAAIAMTLPVAAHAQTVPGAPTREEIDRARAPGAVPADRSRLTVTGGVERAPCALADPRYANVTVNFADVRFTMPAIVDPAALRDSWADMAGHDVPIASLCEIRDRAATALRQMGYLAAVQVPPQRIEKGGTVVFDVLMAKLVGIQVRGNAGNSEKLIAAHLEALKDEPVFNIREAERHLLLARDLPGYDVRLALRPAGTTPGEVIGDVQVTRQRVRIDANIQNMGSQSAGRYGGLLRVQVNDITGMGDSTVLSIFNTAQTREQTVLQAQHSFAIGANGLRLTGDFTYAWSKPGLVNGQLSSTTLIGSLALSYPLIRRQTSNLLGTAGIDIVDQDVKFGGNPLTTDKLRVLFARVEAEAIDPESLVSTQGYSAAEPRWRIGGAIEARQGLSALGASDGCGAGFVRCLPPRTPISRVEGDPTALVLRASAQAEFRPAPILTISVAPRAQYAPHALLSYEEMSAGNYTVGRGYDPGTLIGDSGVGFATEVRLGSLMPKGLQDLSLQPYAFFDAAWMWNRDSSFNGLDPQKLTSAGGGVRGMWGNRARFDLTVAAPLRRAGFQTERGDVRVLFSITAQLVPWR